MRGEREQRPMGRRPNMAAPWLRARERLRRIPELLAGCRDQAAAYGRQRQRRSDASGTASDPAPGFIAALGPGRLESGHSRA
ncbi:NADH dehydrogenase [ubiquinone] 1 alpha subcomplex assembly factor 8 isoform X3 [Alligator mississippiensis]|uniref:NADH dehydrogenase [ubiquinone] 1 alpha subcomplex assembly factor 8 isoform X3 n=1 Tax=Alligator mississippiensis TaxID=8496 RepID=UPI00090724E5|nr:NADH dehydrogenase [ubiquinone] 1 alpha subcomplex assembly factor 8 isoform X3 [Alligator mississippiensis]